MFREQELQQLKQIITAGDSASLVGVRGIGKSNLFNHLLDHDVQAWMFDKQASNYLVIRIDCHYIADLSILSVYSLLLDQLEQCGDHAEYYGVKRSVFEKIAQHHEKMLDANNNLLKVQRQFTLALRLLMRSRQRRLVILLDQFEELWQSADARLFRNLRGIRETYKRRVSFVTFTFQRLPRLHKLDEARAEFFELMAANEIGVKPYNSADSHAMLTNIIDRYKLQRTPQQLDEIVTACAGHAGLMRAWLLSNNHDSAIVVQEAQELYQSLMQDERNIIKNLPNQPIKSEEIVLEWLGIKGMITAEKQIASSLFSQHLANLTDTIGLKIRYEPHIDRRIFIDGTPTDGLTPLEHRVFYCLYQDADATVNLNDIAKHGWDANDGVSDESITQVIRRIREKLKPLGKPTEIVETRRGIGYRFNSSGRPPL